jgi:DNA-binding NarL/FixJ family response regulator
VKTRLLIIDDHQLVLDGLSAIVKDLKTIELIGTASNGKDALTLIEALNPDLVISDIDMPVMNGIQLTETMKRKFPHIKLMLLTMHNEPSLVYKLMELGVDGYLLKNADRGELLTGILKMRKSESFFPEKEIPRSNNSTISPFEYEEETVILSRLTTREIEIIRVIAEGYSSKEIGDELFVSHRRLDTHRTNLMKKLEVHDINGLVNFAIRNGLVS